MRIGTIKLDKVGGINNKHAPSYFIGICEYENSQVCAFNLRNEHCCGQPCEDCPYKNKHLYKKVISLYREVALKNIELFGETHSDEEVLETSIEVLDICNNLLNKNDE